MSRPDEDHAASTDASPSTQSSKRKRSIIPPEDELEIDLNQPEPPSKKTKRKEKKKLLKGGGKGDDIHVSAETVVTEQASRSHKDVEESSAKPAVEQRSEWGVWIGNLLWTTSKTDLRTFLIEQGEIQDDVITRVHMPTPEDKGPTWKGSKPCNKGFAYVDFSSQADMSKAIALSEKLLGGRKVLIKNAKSFEGRPETKQVNAADKVETSKAKAPSKRIFVGNLAFDVSREDIEGHFRQAGEVEDVHLATFQDSGKCKGYGWVRFVELDAAEAAVKGFIYKKTDGGEDESAEEEGEQRDGEQENETKARKSRKQKRQKWFINRLHGRSLRCEFAEDAQTRYRKRYGKESDKKEESTGRTPANDEYETRQLGAREQHSNRKLDKDQRQAQRRQKHEDARNIAPGKALAGAPRSSGAIIQGSGQKTTFE